MSRNAKDFLQKDATFFRQINESQDMAAAACLGPQKNRVDRPVTPAELAPVAMLEEQKETPTRRTSKRRAKFSG